MAKDFLALLHNHSAWSLLFLRLIVGCLFLYYGLQKFGTFGGEPLTGFSSMLSGMGFPLPLFFAVLVAAVETIGGLFLILGFLARYSAFMLMIVMLVATISTFSGGLAVWQFPFVLFFVCIHFVFSGAGRYSFDRRMLMR